MAAVKTQPIDTSKTNPAEFLAGGAPHAAIAAPAAAPKRETAPPTPETPAADPEPTPEPPTPETPPAPAPAAPPAPAPAPVAVQNPEPFVLLYAWETATQKRTLRALPVPGGCIVRSSAINGPILTEWGVFVPGVRIVTKPDGAPDLQPIP